MKALLAGCQVVLACPAGDEETLLKQKRQSDQSQPGKGSRYAERCCLSSTAVWIQSVYQRMHAQFTCCKRQGDA